MIMPEKIPFGVIAPMTTPFAADGELQAASIRSQVEFLVRERADSLAVGGSTGEGQTLSPDELRACVSETRAAMPPEMPLIASAIVDSTRQAVRSIKAVEGLGVDAIQITPVHYLFRPDDEMMIEHFRVIHEETGMPLIIYNVVHWCYLSPELTVRLMNEVPGVMGIKQSAGDLKLFADLMINAPKDRRIYSAVDALMYPSFCLGTPGVIAATPSGIPRATALLRDAVAKGIMSTHCGCTRRFCVSGIPRTTLICRPASATRSRCRVWTPAFLACRCVRLPRRKKRRSNQLWKRC